MKFTVRDIVEIAMLVALAIVLDLPFLKIRIGENGGSISFTMVPLFVLAIRKGPLKGFVGCGIIYGLITCLLDGWGFIYFPFDYLLGYGSVAIAGFFKKKIFENKKEIIGLLWSGLGVICGVVGRFVFSSISSIVFYEFSVVEAAIYNSVYILPSGAISILLIAILYKPLLIVNKLFPQKSI